MAGLIRKAQPTTQPAFSFVDLEQEARQARAQSEARAREILAAARSEAQREAARLRDQAAKQGIAEGRAIGEQKLREESSEQAFQAARSKLEQLGAALTACLQEYDAARNRLMAQAESGLLTLAVAIARRVCKLALSDSSAVAGAQVRELLALAGREKIELRLNPGDFALLEARFPQMLAGLSEPRHASVLPDPQVAPGGCLLTAGSLHVDADIDLQIERIASALLSDARTD